MKKGNVRNGIIGLIIMLVLSGVVAYGSGPLYKVIEHLKGDRTNEAAGGLTDGIYETESTDYDEKGYKDTMRMVIAGGKITELVWDNVDREGKSKAQASLDGEYVMTEEGLTWAEQAELLSDYVISEGTVKDLDMDDDGKTDAVAGVSISVNGFVELTAELLEEAGQSAGGTTAASGLKDGTYQAEGADFDEKGYKDTMKLVVSDGKITELVWDNLDQEGNSKAQASLNGGYVMTEDGLSWAEQAELLADYVIKAGDVNGLEIDENGKTDAVAGVSISINGFIDLAEKVLEQAGGSNKHALRDGRYHMEALEYDEKG